MMSLSGIWYMVYGITLGHLQTKTKSLNLVSRTYLHIICMMGFMWVGVRLVVDSESSTVTQCWS